MSLSKAEINERFGFHKATIEGANATKQRHADLRQLFMDFAETLDLAALDCRQKDNALDDLERASMWIHKAIAQDAPLEP